MDQSRKLYAPDHRTAGDRTARSHTQWTTSEQEVKRQKQGVGESVRVKYKTTQRQYKPMSEKQSKGAGTASVPPAPAGEGSAGPARAGEGLLYK